jgi:hypothetical protein
MIVKEFLRENYVVFKLFPNQDTFRWLRHGFSLRTNHGATTTRSFLRSSHVAALLVYYSHLTVLRLYMAPLHFSQHL